MKSLPFRVVLLTGAALSLPIDAAWAQAADASDPAPAANSGQIADIIVTARKREEGLISVPVAVTAVSGAELARAGVSDLSRLQQIAPEVQVSRADSGAGGSFKIRGLGTPYSDAGTDPSVGINIDGMQASRGNSVVVGFFDLAQVEVLKGPQALFFGKNNPAGVISLRSANPTDRFSGYVRAGYEFEAEEKVVEGAVSGPLTDTLKARIAVRGGSMVGWLKNTAVPIASNPFFGGLPTTGRTHKSNGGKDLMGRFTLAYSPTSDFDATLKVAGGLHKDHGSTGQIVCFHPGAPVTFTLGGQGFADPGGDCKLDGRYQQAAEPPEISVNVPGSNGGVPYLRVRSVLTTLNLNYRTENLALTSVSGYTRNHSRQATDFSYSSYGSTLATLRELYSAWSQEFRITSDYDSPVNFMMGAYFDSTRRFNRTGTFLGFAGQDPVSGRFDTHENKQRASGKTYSGFGQLRWKVLSDVELSGGVRYTHESKKSFILMTHAHSALAGPFGLQPVGVPLSGDFTFSDDNWSPEFTASWKPMRDSLLYLSYKTGYKSGGFSSPNLVQTFQNAGNLSYESERSHGFELGAKTLLANRTLRLQAAVYNFLYKNLQVSQFDQATFSYFIVNAASARLKGIEFSGLWRATPELQFNGQASYNKATYASFPTGQCYVGQTVAQGCVNGAQDLTGRTLTGAPRWTFSGGATYDFDVGPDLKLGLSTDATYSGSYITAEDHAPVTVQKSYALFNAGVRLYQANDNWELAFIGRNLANKYYKLVSSSKPFALPDEYFTFTPRARELRVQGTYRF